MALLRSVHILSSAFLQQFQQMQLTTNADHRKPLTTLNSNNNAHNSTIVNEKSVDALRHSVVQLIEILTTLRQEVQHLPPYSAALATAHDTTHQFATLSQAMHFKRQNSLLIQRYEDKLKSVLTQHQNYKQQHAQTHQTAVQQLETKYNVQIHRLEQELSDQRVNSDSKFTQLESKYETQLSQLKSQHEIAMRDALQDCESRAQTRIATLQREHTSTKQASHVAHAQHIAQMEQQFESELTQRELLHAAAMAQQDAEMQRAKTHTHAQYQQQLDELHVQTQRTKAQFEQKLDAAQQETRRLSLVARREMQQSQSDIVQYKQQHDALERRMDELSHALTAAELHCKQQELQLSERDEQITQLQRQFTLFKQQTVENEKLQAVTVAKLTQECDSRLTTQREMHANELQTQQQQYRLSSADQQEKMILKHTSHVEQLQFEYERERLKSEQRRESELDAAMQQHTLVQTRLERSIAEATSRAQHTQQQLESVRSDLATIERTLATKHTQAIAALHKRHDAERARHKAHSARQDERWAQRLEQLRALYMRRDDLSCNPCRKRGSGLRAIALRLCHDTQHRLTTVTSAASAAPQQSTSTPNVAASSVAAAAATASPDSLLASPTTQAHNSSLFDDDDVKQSPFTAFSDNVRSRSSTPSSTSASSLRSLTHLYEGTTRTNPQDAFDLEDAKLKSKHRHHHDSPSEQYRFTVLGPHQTNPALRLSETGALVMRQRPRNQDNRSAAPAPAPTSIFMPHIASIDTRVDQPIAPPVSAAPVFAPNPTPVPAMSRQPSKLLAPIQESLASHRSTVEEAPTASAAQQPAPSASIFDQAHSSSAAEPQSTDALIRSMLNAPEDNAASSANETASPLTHPISGPEASPGSATSGTASSGAPQSSYAALLNDYINRYHDTDVSSLGLSSSFKDSLS